MILNKRYGRAINVCTFHSGDLKNVTLDNLTYDIKSLFVLVRGPYELPFHIRFDQGQFSWILSYTI
jgi:hypothetical protein